MIAESGIFPPELMSKPSHNEAPNSSSHPREDIVEELLNFSWGSDGRNSLDAMDSSGTSHSSTGLSCGQEMSLSSTLEKSVKLKDPDVQLHAQSLRSYSTSDLLDLGTVVKDFDDDACGGKHLLNASSDVRIPEYELDVISEDYTPVALTTRAPVVNSRTSAARPGRSSGNLTGSENANGNANGTAGNSSNSRLSHASNLHHSHAHTMQRPVMDIGMRPGFSAASGENGSSLFTREKAGSQVYTPQKTLAQVSENETLKSELNPDQTLRAQTQAAANEAKAVRRKRFLRRRSSERKPFENVPEFIKEELMTTSGIGHFTMSELMCCLLFAHREALSSNSYANIRAKMGNKRSRVSIRRKIEKIVLSETGLGGGLLGLTGDQNQLVLEAIWNRLMNLISDAETYGTQNLKLFAAQLREYAQNPLKFAVREQRR